jgi:hypothetical protein
MGVAAGLAATAAAGSLASAGAQIANGGGGSTSQSYDPDQRAYLRGGDAAAFNWLPYYASGAGPGRSTSSSLAFGAAPGVYGTNNAFLTGAQGAAAPFTSGQYVGSNPAYGLLGGMAQGGATPYLDATYNLAAGKVRSALDSQFEGAGRYGGGAHQAAIASNLNDLATSLYGGQYNADQNRALQAGSALGNIAQGERQQQLGALALAPSLSGAQTANVGGLLSAGNYNDQLMQRDFYTPLDSIQRIQNIFNGNQGGTSTVPYFTNPTAGLLGGAALGLDAYKTFANQPQQQNTPINGLPGAYSNVNPNTFNYYANDGAYLSY